MSILAQVALSELSNGIYRPPNWGNGKQVYSITCTLPPNGPTSGTNNNTSSSSPSSNQMPTTFYFDATLHVDHSQEAIGTEHPAQVGPAVVDHIYLRPYEMTLEVAISDAMQSFQAGQYSGGTSRSVNAFQTFLQISAARVPITVSTRLNTMSNMWLRLVRGAEDHRTSRSFRGALYFKQMIQSQLSSTPVSQRPQATNTTNEGTKSPSVPPVPVIDDIPLGVNH